MRLQALRHRCHDWCGDVVVGKCGEQMNVAACNQLFTTSACLLCQVAHGELVFETNGVIDCVESLRNLTVGSICFEVLLRCEVIGRRRTLSTVLSGIRCAISCNFGVSSSCAIGGLVCGIRCAIGCNFGGSSAGAMGGALCGVCCTICCYRSLTPAGAMGGVLCGI